MIPKPHISSIRMEKATGFAPLAIIGAYIRTYDLLSPIMSRLAFSQKMHTHHPKQALIDIWVSILAGCRSISQINPKLRPEISLAKAWGREQFREQPTLARVLDACQAEQVDQLRSGVEMIYRWIGQAPDPNCRRSPLMIDIDLTGMPAGRKAEGSTKGYFSGKRGDEADNYAELGQPITMKVSVPYCIQVIN